MATRAPVARFSKARQKIFRPTERQFTGEDFWRTILQNTEYLKDLEPQFHLQSLGNASNPDVILFRMVGLEIKVNLLSLKVKLVLSNILVLIGSMIAFQGWLWVDELKREAMLGLSRAQKARDPMDLPHPVLHEYNHVIAHGFADAGGVLYCIGWVLMLSYLLFGFWMPLQQVIRGKFILGPSDHDF